MSNNLNVSSSTSSTGTTANPQPNTKSNYQGQPINSLQNNNASSNINNSPRGGKTVPINNFNLSSIAEDHSSTTSATSNSSSAAIAIVIVVVILAFFVMYISSKSRSPKKKIQRKKH